MLRCTKRRVLAPSWSGSRQPPVGSLSAPGWSPLAAAGSPDGNQPQRWRCRKRPNLLSQPVA